MRHVIWFWPGASSVLTIASMNDRTIDVRRRIAADPTSAVLMLASPAAAEFWPGLTLEGAEPGEHIAVSVQLPSSDGDVHRDGEPIKAVIRAEPPVRTPTSFVIRFSFVATSVPHTDGTLTLTHAPTEDGGAATDAHLNFTVSSGPFATESLRAMLDGLASTFLNNLSVAAERRSRAA
jgi:hypothetical protein